VEALFTLALFSATQNNFIGLLWQTLWKLLSPFKFLKENFCKKNFYLTSF